MRVFLSANCPEFSRCLDELQSIAICRTMPDGSIPQADLYIWEYEPGIDEKVESAARQSAPQLVLANPKDLEHLGTVQSAACVLLRPVSPVTARAFIDLALKSWEARQRAEQMDALRMDRDTLLQYVLEVNLRLQEYDGERSNFLARALHDFRAPLTALHGYCGLLAEGKLGTVTPAQQELLERMRYSSRRLTRLAGGMLELLLEGRFEQLPDRSAGDMEETVSQALHDVYPFIQDKGIDITVQVEPPEEEFLYEPEQIQQVLVNLLENSCKFTPRNGSIEVRGYPVLWDTGTNETIYDPSLEGQANGYRIDIFDSGSGVPATLAEKIFEQYASYSGSGDRSGGGLGLAICRAIVSSHKGKIWATPSQEGGRFSLVLPLESAPAMKPGGQAAGRAFVNANVAC
jgi:signal transduction histidine kinase